MPCSRLSRSLGWPLGLAAVALAASGCLPSIDDLNTGPLTQTFAVSDYYAPSGYMGDGEFFGKLVGTANEGCRPRVPGARGNCYSFSYLPNDTDVDPWAGVFWVFPSNSWGSTAGHAIDVTNFKQISFWAAVEGPTPFTTDGGGLIPFQGQAGGIDPNGSFTTKTGTNYRDGVYVKQGFAIGSDVTTEMKQFHIPIGPDEFRAGCNDPSQLVAMHQAANCTGGLDGFNAGTEQAFYLIGAFAFALHYPVDAVQCSDPKVDCHSPVKTSNFYNPPPVKIFLDDIVWSTDAPPATP
jgi:hypothetical protein